MNQHVLGVYWSPQHKAQRSDREYIEVLQPPLVRILDPGLGDIADVHRIAPDALIALRYWTVDDHDGRAVRDLMADPTGTGVRHAREYRSILDGLQQEAQRTGVRIPRADRLVFNAANEPNQGGEPAQIAAYNVAFLDECTRLGLRAAALCLGVGWPASKSSAPESPVDWQPYVDAGLEQAIKRGGHLLELHEYCYKSGPQDGWRWFCGRHLQCPLDVPILLGEIGIDNYVDAERWKREGGARGWVGNVGAEQYADMIAYHIRNSDSRVMAALPFITDYRDANNWASFDTRDAHQALLARAHQMKPGVKFQQHTVHLPVITAPTEPQPQPNNDWTRARAFVARWEGGFVNNPADPGGATNMGITISTLKAWRASKGMPAPTVEDVRNLTTAEADAIYHAWYWQASGADKLPWPLSLIVFDTAVLHGTAIARQWHSETGGNATDYLAKRLASYTRMGHWKHFGAGWVRRVADLLDMLA